MAPPVGGGGQLVGGVDGGGKPSEWLVRVGLRGRGDWWAAARRRGRRRPRVVVEVGGGGEGRGR
jgi:hypothetical protein